jgi:hypothetical protein
MIFAKKMLPSNAGRKVEDGFSYSSGNNTWWLSVEEIRERLNTLK